MVPVYVFYSMFGFQRTGDALWAAADQMSRGFLIGATAGRTTLTGEGLQHADGHSPILASTNPAVVAYDPAYGYEIGHIVQDGLRRMFGEAPEDVFYYLTVYNENYVMPAMPAREGIEAEIVRGLYWWQAAPEQTAKRATVLFSGSAQSAARVAAEDLAKHYDVGVELWSATSYKALRDEALEIERWNRLHPGAAPRTPLVASLLTDAPGPIVAVTDFMKIVPEQVARFLPGRTFVPLGTDGMGRSDTREALRRLFEVDAGHVVVAVLAALAAEGEAKPEQVADAIARYGIDADAPSALAL
jgi:pyruvate dehydrogenase E1 component